jgi:hypothetical protein
MPWIATVSPGRAPLLRNALQVVTPARSSGPASSAASPSGIRASGTTAPPRALGGAVIADAPDLRVIAADEVAAATGLAPEAVPAVPADAHPNAFQKPCTSSPTASMTPATS